MKQKDTTHKKNHQWLFFATLKKFQKSQDSSALCSLCSEAKSQITENKAGLILLPFLKVSKLSYKVISIFLLVFHWRKLCHMSIPKPITSKGSLITMVGLDQRFSTLSILKNHAGASKNCWYLTPTLRFLFNGPHALFNCLGAL